jgi:excisionase family DNA binding protein
MTEELYTVDAAAERLKLHNKTVLRFIREGRLRATKVGKQYRILRSDLYAFAGVVQSAQEAATARVTAVIDVAGVDDALLRRLTSVLLGARIGNERAAQAMTIDIAHDPGRVAAKVIAVGIPADVAQLLTLVDACLGT